MRRNLIFIMLVLASTLTSCDYMRKMTGRPTSEEVAQIKGEIERLELLRQEEATLRANIDSLYAVREALQDTIANVIAEQSDSAAATEQQVEVVEIVQPVQVAQTQKRAPVDNSRYLTPYLENRYYVIIGVFQEYRNARALMDKAAKYGYSPVLVGCKDGLIGVGVCPVDEYEDAIRAQQILRREKFCPADIWIYTNR
jgi:hypothetical protein